MGIWPIRIQKGEVMTDELIMLEIIVLVSFKFLFLFVILKPDSEE